MHGDQTTEDQLPCEFNWKIDEEFIRWLGEDAEKDQNKTTPQSGEDRMEPAELGTQIEIPTSNSIQVPTARDTDRNRRSQRSQKKPCPFKGNGWKTSRSSRRNKREAERRKTLNILYEELRLAIPLPWRPRSVKREILEVAINIIKDTYTTTGAAESEKSQRITPQGERNEAATVITYV